MVVERGLTTEYKVHIGPKPARYYQPLPQNCEKHISFVVSDYSSRPSVRMEQHGSYWIDFHEI